jgi:hypothetical protein
MGVNDGVRERESAFSSSKSSLGYFSISTEQKHKKKETKQIQFSDEKEFSFSKKECMSVCENLLF